MIRQFAFGNLKKPLKAVFSTWPFLFCAVLFLFPVSAKEKNTGNAPTWAFSEGISQAFPDELYLARSAFADDPDSARLKADAELASYFSTEIRSRVSASESYATGKNNVSESAERHKNLELQISVSSNARLPALRHTEAYYFKQEKSWCVCSYINREEAWSLIEPKLSSVSNKIESELKLSAQDKEPFFKALHLNRALKEEKEFHELYFVALCLVPGKAARYSTLEADILKGRNQKAKMEGQIKISLIVQGDNVERVEAKLSELFSMHGFSVSMENARYFVDAKSSVEAIESARVFVCYPRISVFIKKNNGEAIASWARQFPKVASYTKEACERMAMAKIEGELENVFITECLNAR